MKGLSFNNNIYTLWELMVEIKCRRNKKKILYNLSKNYK